MEDSFKKKAARRKKSASASEGCEKGNADGRKTFGKTEDVPENSQSGKKGHLAKIKLSVRQGGRMESKGWG